MNETVAPPPPPSDHGEGPEAPRTGMNTAALGDYRGLRRSATDRKVAGVAGGLARHLDVDPLLVRVLLFVLVFFGGAGLLLYLALWLLVPDERDGHVVVPSDDSTRNVLVIVALVVAGLIALSTGVGGDSAGVWFLCVVALGALAFYLVRQSRRDARQGWTGPTAPGAGPATGWSGPTDPTARYDAPPAAGTAAPPPPGTPPAYGGWTPPPGTPPAYAGWTPPPYSWTPRRRRGPLLFMPTLALIALGLGVLGLFDTNGYDVPDAGYPALALALVGAMLVVGSFFGRAGGLVLLALVSAAAMVGSAVAEPSYSGTRDLTVTPTSTTALADSYSLPAGRITLDLSRLREPGALAGRELDLDVNAGEIVVVVPGYVDVDVDARVRFGGAIDTPDGLTHDGWGTDVQRVYAGPPGVTGPPLRLVLNADFGHIDIRRG